MFKPLEQFVNSATWLDSLGDPLQQAITRVFSEAGPNGKQIKNMLNGVWLGHPLHPMLTDVPVGAWTCTALLDMMSKGSDDAGLQKAADVTLATGLLAGAGAALTGWTDWSDTYGSERKLGLLHGLTMASSLAWYTFSLLARLSGHRSAGRKLATVGYLTAGAGAYLGGDQVFDLGYGVNHTAFEHGPSKYTRIMADGELAENTPTKADADGVSVVLVKQGKQIYALADTCVHAGCSLSGGAVEGQTIVCPCHGSQFDLRDGAVINGPATRPEPSYKVRVKEGSIEVKGA